MELSQATLGFLGAGHMGQSMIHGLLAQTHAPKKILICDHHPERLKELKQNRAIELTQDPLELTSRADMIVLAVKPQSMHSALLAMRGFDKHHQPLFLSIAAGVTLSQLRNALGVQHDYPVIRAMPNTPATIGAGISGLFTDLNLPPQTKKLCEALLNAMGESVWVEKETLMNVVTALSGSGPAYYFLFAEQLVLTAMDLGLNETTAKKLCLATGIGALRMASQSPYTLSELRQQVTSKGGTTEAALNSLKEAGFDNILAQALKKAEQRGKELSDALDQQNAPSTD